MKRIITPALPIDTKGRLWYNYKHNTRLYELLEAERYSDSTMRDMRFILHSMSNFMKTNRLEEYSPEIGEQFVAHCANDLHICSSRITRAKNIVAFEISHELRHTYYNSFTMIRMKTKDYPKG